jgi:DNA-directed RNA polymerase specialized sigma24 family protein
MGSVQIAFERFDRETQNWLLKRFRAAARKRMVEFGFFQCEVDDLVQEALTRVFPKDYDITPYTLVKVMSRVIANIILSERRKSRSQPSSYAVRPQHDEDSEHNDIPVVLDARPDPELHLTHIQELRVYLMKTEEYLRDLESILSTRRTDFRARVRELFLLLRSNPEKYLEMPSPEREDDKKGDTPETRTARVRVQELVKDLCLKNANTYQQRMRRVDEMLTEHGISLDRILLGIASEPEAQRIISTAAQLRRGGAK